MAFTAGRNTAIAESTRNSAPPRIVDPVTLDNGIAFFTGEVHGDDEDFFGITAAADGTLQVELSHFDTATDSLYLEILDGDLNTVAMSDTDGFELVDVPMTAGATYFIGVLPKGDSETPIEYILSIVVN